MIRAAILALGLAMSAPAHGQTLHHPDHGPEHPFAGWKTENGVSCCDDADCVFADVCTTPDGREGWRENGQYWALPYERERPLPKGEKLRDERQRAVCRIMRQPLGGGQSTPGFVFCWGKGYDA